jgi:hypothetical protein
MTQIDVEEIIAMLSERGRLEWELATKTVLIAAQRREIMALSNGHEPDAPA